jgi:hypothetical protein
LARLAGCPEIDCVYGPTEQFISSEIDPAIRATRHCPAGAQLVRFAGAMLVRKNVFDQIGFFEVSVKVGETMDWVARFEEHGLLVAAVDEVVLKRRIHTTNTVIKEKHRRSDYLKILKTSIDRRRERQNSHSLKGVDLES